MIYLPGGGCLVKTLRGPPGKRAWSLSPTMCLKLCIVVRSEC